MRNFLFSILLFQSIIWNNVISSVHHFDTYTTRIFSHNQQLFASDYLISDIRPGLTSIYYSHPSSFFPPFFIDRMTTLLRAQQHSLTHLTLHSDFLSPNLPSSVTLATNSVMFAYVFQCISKRGMDSPQVLDYLKSLPFYCNSRPFSDHSFAHFFGAKDGESYQYQIDKALGYFLRSYYYDYYELAEHFLKPQTIHDFTDSFLGLLQQTPDLISLTMHKQPIHMARLFSILPKSKLASVTLHSPPLIPGDCAALISAVKQTTIPGALKRSQITSLQQVIEAAPELAISITDPRIPYPHDTQEFDDALMECRLFKARLIRGLRDYTWVGLKIRIHQTVFSTTLHSTTGGVFVGNPCGYFWEPASNGQAIARHLDHGAPYYITDQIRKILK